MKAKEIIEMLETPENDKMSLKSYISAQASTTDIVNSLRLATDTHTQQILSDIAGDRYEEAAVPMLIEYLQNSSPGVRGAAADALGKIGDRRAGSMLMERFDQLEKDRGVRHMLATALGACGYREAIPLLIEALNDSDPVLRGCAAWGLGAMGAESAEDALRTALQHETDNFAKDRIREKLNAIVLVNQALNIEDPVELLTRSMNL
ncbi:MAG: HEAT repeat domain-containing protein, partial [Chloroflexota bacterium]